MSARCIAATADRPDRPYQATRYGISLTPSSNDVLQLELAVTNAGTEPWRDVFVDTCLMHIRAPEFYDPDYRRTFVRTTEKQHTCVGDLALAPQRPIFIRDGRDTANMHFYAPVRSQFWTWSVTRVAGNRVQTHSRDGRWSVTFGWENIQLIACNWDKDMGAFTPILFSATSHQARPDTCAVKSHSSEGPYEFTPSNRPTALYWATAS